MLAEIELTWPEEIAHTTRHRFRHADDVVLDFLYHHYLLGAPAHAGRHSWAGLTRSSLYYFVMLTPQWRSVIAELAMVNLHKPRFVCVNDDLGSDFAFSTWVARRHLRLVLQNCLGAPSSFEIR